MRIERSVRDMVIWAEKMQRSNRMVGLVPTMGALHEGHLSLVNLLESRCEIKVASILVNPLQFEPDADLEKYPRNEKNDIKLLKEAGCDVAFIPPLDNMFTPEFSTYVEEESLSKGLCGRYRPTHFRGVTTIVSRLFNLTRCNIAAFGLKDFQQTVVIRRMVENLFMPVKLIFGDTIREKDGLALSSRNRYLNAAQRRAAVAIPRSLEWARREASRAEIGTSTLLKGVEFFLSGDPELTLQYVEVVDPLTLQPLEKITDIAQLLIAVYCGETRLIDNIEIGPESPTKPLEMTTV